MSTIPNLAALEHQEAIVKAKDKRKKVKTVNYVIPGGKNLFKEGTSLTELNTKFYNWLRFTQFEEATMSFAQDTSKYTTEKIKLVDFTTSDIGSFPWQKPTMGISWLANQMATQYLDLIKNKTSVVKLHVSSDGLYAETSTKKDGILSPKAADWKPSFSFLVKNREQY